jgi:hypothetical protein
VGGTAVAVGAGGWVGAGVAAGAQAAKTNEATSSTNRVTIEKRFILISIVLDLYLFCVCIVHISRHIIYNTYTKSSVYSLSHQTLIRGQYPEIIQLVQEEYPSLVPHQCGKILI